MSCRTSRVLHLKCTTSFVAAVRPGSGNGFQIDYISLGIHPHYDIKIRSSNRLILTMICKWGCILQARGGSVIGSSCAWPLPCSRSKSVNKLAILVVLQVMVAAAGPPTVANLAADWLDAGPEVDMPTVNNFVGSVGKSTISV